MRRWILVGALLLVPILALAACGGDGDDGGGGGAAAPPNDAAPSDEVMVELAEQNNSGESGTATLTAMGEQTRVVVEIPSQITPSQPAHIHEGSCGPALNPAPLHGLLNVMDGRSETVVDRPLSELTAGGLAINVHESNEELETHVACGNLAGGTEASAGTGVEGY